jgi:hypothetical protein
MGGRSQAHLLENHLIISGDVSDVLGSFLLLEIDRHARLAIASRRHGKSDLRFLVDGSGVVSWCANLFGCGRRRWMILIILGSSRS